MKSGYDQHLIKGQIKKAISVTCKELRNCSTNNSNNDKNTFTGSGLQCLVGANEPAVTNGCLAANNNEIVIEMMMETASSLTLLYTYDIVKDTVMTSIQSAWTSPNVYRLSTTIGGGGGGGGGSSNMLLFGDSYRSAVEYYGTTKFLNDYLLAALNGETFDGTNGAAIFFNTKTRPERHMAMATTILWANYMKVLHHWDQVVAATCNSNNDNNNDDNNNDNNDESDDTILAVDAATAAYVTTTNSPGSLYGMANDVCQSAGTCSSNNNNNTVANVNEEILQLSIQLQLAMFSGDNDCEQVEGWVQSLKSISRIPWIQQPKKHLLHKSLQCLPSFNKVFPLWWLKEEGSLVFIQSWRYNLHPAEKGINCAGCDDSDRSRIPQNSSFIVIVCLMFD